MKRTFLLMLSALLLTVSVGSTAAKRIVTHDKMCYWVFVPDEELVCVDIP